MYALFAKINDEWRFEGLQQHEEMVTEFEESVQLENGEGSAFWVELPE
jgi:hypothetical protein